VRSYPIAKGTGVPAWMVTLKARSDDYEVVVRTGNRRVIAHRRAERTSHRGAIYIIIGVVVAAGHHYFEHLDAVKPIVSAVLAVLLWPLWPLVLLGVSLHLK
jgi:hypothetical protein